MESDRQQKKGGKKTHVNTAKSVSLLVDYCDVYNVFVPSELGILLKKVKWG